MDKMRSKLITIIKERINMKKRVKRRIKERNQFTIISRL
jgi:hypothetical protein